MEQSKFYQIKNVTEHEYTLVGCDGSVITRSIQDVDKSASAFTIQDAKDGDVLCSGQIIVIFKHFEDPSYRQHIVAYIGLDISGNVQITDDTWSLGIDKVEPATKKQRDTLFAKMKEAGFEWDDEKKELKKIVAPIFNIGDTIIKKHNSDINDFGQFTITDITGGKYWYNDRIICDITDQNNWELVEQKPAWSEEDEYHKRQILRILKDNGCSQTLQDRTEKWIEERLKYLRPQKQWKPSDEQMEALESATENCAYSEYQDCLMELIAQLKKLRRE